MVYPDRVLLFKTLYMNPKQQQNLINDMLLQCSDRENTFPIIDKDGKFQVPVLSNSGIVQRYETKPIPDKGFRGLVLEVNDHGNVSITMYYKNGKIKEVASRV